MSVVRENLMNEPGYAPYCGNQGARGSIGGCDNPRLIWKSELGQFKCPTCHLVTEFPPEFIAAYLAKWNK